MDCSALADLGRLGWGTQSSHQQPPHTHTEGPGRFKGDPQLWPAHSLQNTSWAAELPSGFTLPQLTLTQLLHPKAVLCFLLPYLQ